jgi:hypothetical protein
MNAASGATLGAGWLALYAESNLPLAIVGGARAADMAPYKGALTSGGALLVEKWLAKERATLPPALQSATTLAQVLEITNAQSSPSGVALQAGWNDAEGISTWSTSIAFDPSKTKNLDAASRDWIERLVKSSGPRYEAASAFSADAFGLGFGPSGAARAIAAARGQLPAETRADHYPKGTFFGADVDLGRAVTAFRTAAAAFDAPFVAPVIPEGTRVSVALVARDGLIELRLHGSGLTSLLKSPTPSP